MSDSGKLPPKAEVRESIKVMSSDRKKGNRLTNHTLFVTYCNMVCLFVYLHLNWELLEAVLSLERNKKGQEKCYSKADEIFFINVHTMGIRCYSKISFGKHFCVLH